jgi:DNA-binding transcriptional MerR regulator
MRIGELADRVGLSTKAIRYYEQIAVLPAPPRTPSGYREYPEVTIDRLKFVRAAQAVGLSLGEIREVLALRDRGETPCHHVADLIQARAADVEAKIAELEVLRTELKRLAKRAAKLKPSDCRPGEICHIIPG